MFIFTPSVSISKLDSHSMGVSFPWDSHGIPIPCRALRCKTGPVFDWLVPATDRVRLTASKRAVLRRRMRDSTTVSPNSSFFNSHKSGCNKTVLFITLHPRVIFRHRNRKKTITKQPNRSHGLTQSMSISDPSNTVFHNGGQWSLQTLIREVKHTSLQLPLNGACLSERIFRCSVSISEKRHIVDCQLLATTQYFPCRSLISPIAESGK